MSTEGQTTTMQYGRAMQLLGAAFREKPEEANNMIAQELELFLHGQGAKPRSMFATRTEPLREALLRAGVIREGADEILVFVGECEEALVEPDEEEDGCDLHAPVDTSLTVEVLEIERYRHVHCHTCRHVATEVIFNGDTKRRRFSPSATVGTVRQWARRKFRLDPVAAAEYVLQITGTTEQPRSDKHLGELVKAGTCSLSLEFVKEITHQG